MATSTLTFYKTRLIPSRNAGFDNIETWLTDDVEPNDRLVLTEFQYIKFNNDIEITIPFSQVNFNGVFPYNYVKIVNEGERPFYYFIMKPKWNSKNACSLELSIDSVNTFPEWKNALTSQTKIIRQHEDRFFRASGGVLSPKVSKTDEGIGSLPKYALRNSEVVKPSLPPDGARDIISKNWYSIFSNASGESTAPLVSKLVCEDSLNFEATPSNLPMSCNPWDYTTEIWYGHNNQWLMTSVDNGTNATATLQLSFQDSNGVIHNFPSYSVNTSLVDSDSNSHAYSVVELNAVRQAVSIVFIIRKHFYNSNRMLERTETILNDYRFTYGQQNYHSFAAAGVSNLGNIFTFNNANRLIRTEGFNESTNFPYSTIANYFKERVISSGTYRLKSIAFKDIDRSDSKLVKIIEWPYCPIDGASYTLKIQPNIFSLNLPEGYHYDNDGYIYANNLYPIFKNYITDRDIPLEGFVDSAPEDKNACYLPKNINLETKLYNSNFYSAIFYYDVDYYEVKMENFTNEIPGMVDVYFYASNSMASKLFFKIEYNEPYLEENRFEGILSSIKNNEMSILNNAYLEYLKTGYNYDKKQIEDTTKMSALSVGLQVVGAAASYISSIWTGGAGIAAGIALSASIAGSIASSINNYQLRESSLQNKVNQLKNQGASVASINDLDLSKQYGGNKLRYNVYGVKDEIKQSLFDLFYYCGYAKNAKGIPNMNSRVWFNYIQLEPVFDYKLIPIPQNFIDDISARLNAGLTIYHYFDENFDYEQELENWETSIINNL